MNTTVSFVLAIAALVIAAMSAVFAGWSIRQTKTYHPRPNWIATWDAVHSPVNDMSRPVLRIELDQLGPGDAVNVHWFLNSPQHKQQWLPLTRAKDPKMYVPGSSKEFEIGMVRGDLAATTLNGLLAAYEGDAVAGTYKVRVEWGESPYPEKVRKKILSRTVSVLETAELSTKEAPGS
jgi:hypothetical protein